MSGDVIFLPEITDPGELQQLLGRASFYLHPLLDGTARIVVVTDLALPLELELGEDFDPRCAELYASHRRYFEVLSPDGRSAIESTVERAQAVFRFSHDRDDEPGHRRLYDVASQTGPLWNVDRERDRMEGSIYIEALFRTMEDRDQIVERSRSRFLDALAEAGGLGKSYLIGTGPSSNRFREYDFSDGVAVACNTIVLDEEIMEHAEPYFVCFADPIFHFGCSTYSATFRESLRKAAARWDFWVVIPLKYWQLFASLEPGLAGRTIAVPMSPGTPINLDLLANFQVRTIDNIMTLLMLPVGSTVARDVNFIGFDGRAPREDYFWEHNPRTQLVDLMDNIKRVHPGFFNIDYEDYYDQHCANVERYLTVGEQAGIRFTSLTSSFVPALRRRSTEYFEDDMEKALASDVRYRVVSLNPDLETSFGHYRHYDQRIEEGVREDDGDLVTFAGRALLEPDAANTIPVFTHNSYGVVRPNFRLYARTFESDSARALDKLFELDASTPTVVMAYLMGPQHVPALVRLAERYSSLPVRFVGNLFYAHAEYLDYADGPASRTPLTADVLRLTTELRTALRVDLHVDSVRLQRLVLRSTGEELPLWPMFSVTDLDPADTGGEVPTRTPRTVTVYAPGNVQYDKGYDLTAELVQRMSEDAARLGIRFVARAIFQPTTDERLRRAAATLREHATVLEGVLDDETYERSLADADVVLLPYRRQAFHSRTSAALSDALTLGKPVIATADTWLGDIVERFDAGATFRDGDVTDLRRALLEVRDGYPYFAARAREASRVWIEENNVDQMVRLLRRSAARTSVRTSPDIGPVALDGFVRAMEELAGGVRSRDEERAADSRVRELEAQLERTRERLKTTENRAGVRAITKMGNWLKRYPRLLRIGRRVARWFS